MILTAEKVTELLRLKSDGYLFHRESSDLEFKEQFNLAGLAEYFRDFAAFANNIGGYIIFGVSNSPRKLVGLKDSSLEQFEKIDPEKISEYLLEIFSPMIAWEQNVFSIKEKHFGVFYIYECKEKPVIAKKNEGKDLLIKSGEVYFRYSGRTQKADYAELHNMINRRLEKQNQDWLNLHKKIAKIGPYNAAILDTETGLIEKDENRILVIEESLVKKINFIREGAFDEKEGGKTLKLIGDVQAIDSIEVSRTVAKRLLEKYPLTYNQVLEEVKKALPRTKQGQINLVMKDSALKTNKDYSDYNFRSKLHQDKFEKTGKLPLGTPSLYNKDAVDFIIRVLRNNEQTH